MKTRNKKTLVSFLTKVNAKRRMYGDMVMTKLKDQTGKMDIQFSGHSKVYRFDWDRNTKNWILMEN